MHESIPVPDAQELEPREAVQVMREHFGWSDETTKPMALKVTPEDEFRERLRRAGLATVQVDVWEGRA